MKTYFALLVMLIVTAVLIMSGCNKSDNPTGPTTNDPQKAAERVNQANQIMIPRIASIYATQGSDTSQFNMSGAISLYREALTYDSTNTNAHLGLALTEFVHLASDHDFWALFQEGAGLMPGVTKGTVLLSPEYAMGVKEQIHKTALPFSKGGNPLVPYSSYLKDFMKITGLHHPPSFYQNLVELRILPVLSDVIVHLNFLTRHPNFAFYITPSMVSGQLPDSVRIDLMEVYILLVAVQGLASECSFAVSYNIDYADTNASEVAQAWQVTSSFLQLRANGLQRMRDTKTYILGMATSVQNGINFLINQTPHPGIQLIQYRPADLPKLNQIKYGMDSIKQAFTTTIQEQGVSVNMGSFFDNPIGNFKAKIPSYTVDGTVQQPDGKYNVVLRWQALSYATWVFPDPTFNGVFPGMTDPELKLHMELTADQWEPTIVIGGD